ncbi:MAG: hypothetical protein JNK87_18865 [Bryobacterales bacterium]|nr:hypothetical protein [Bryobacterales bacterium]
MRNYRLRPEHCGEVLWAVGETVAISARPSLPKKTLIEAARDVASIQRPDGQQVHKTLHQHAGVPLLR